MRSDVAAICGAIALVLSGVATACSCSVKTSEPWDSPLPIVFLARITSAQLLPVYRHNIQTVSARFEVVERFRGDPEVIEALKTDAGGFWGTCGIPFTVGDRFVVFTDKSGWVHQCSGTQSFHPVRDEHLLDRLRKLDRREP